MNELATLANNLIGHLNGTFDLSDDEFNRLQHEFGRVLQQTNDATHIKEVVAVESQAWLLPFELVERLYLRAEELGIIDDDMVMWYASRLMFYGEPSDERKAQELLSRHGLSLPQ